MSVSAYVSPLCDVNLPFFNVGYRPQQQGSINGVKCRKGTRENEQSSKKNCDVTFCDLYLLCLHLKLTARWQSPFLAAGVLKATQAERQIIQSLQEHQKSGFSSFTISPARSPVCLTLNRNEEALKKPEAESSKRLNAFREINAKLFLYLLWDGSLHILQ